MDKTVPAGAALLLDFIYRTETSEAPPACYAVIYGHKQHKLVKPLTAMTLDEVVKAQRAWSKNHGSSAAGAPQFMRNTLIGLMEELGLRGSQKLDPDLQDRLAYHLLKRRGYEGFLAGTISRSEFGKRLAQEWASFPVLAGTKGAHRSVKRGFSYYAGDGLNKSLTKPETVEAVLDRVKAAGNAVAPVDPVIIEKPVVADPEELETPTTKSKTFWTWLLTAIGAPVAAFGNLDWRVQLAIVAVIVGFAVYVIKRRNDLAKAVKDLKAEFG
jgi:muramidase (phage lysozyme)